MDNAGDWFYVETACLILLVIFGINYYLGCKQNRRIVLSWFVASFLRAVLSRRCVAHSMHPTRRGRAFAALLESNFSRLGEGGGLLVKESESKYRVPATGRRNCQGLQATLTVRSSHSSTGASTDVFTTPCCSCHAAMTSLQQSIISSVRPRTHWYVLVAALFQIPLQYCLIVFFLFQTVEVALENNVDPFVFAVVPNSRAKSAPKDIPDLVPCSFSCPYPNVGSLIRLSNDGIRACSPNRFLVRS